MSNLDTQGKEYRRYYGILGWEIIIVSKDDDRGSGADWDLPEIRRALGLAEL